MESFDFLLNVLTLQNMGAMFVGIVVGLIIGAIPGLGPPMAIALMIPISFEWPPETALILMVSTYAAGIYGAAWPAEHGGTPPPGGFGIPWGPWGPYGAHGAHGGPSSPPPLPP